jgi:hypothetical protein
MSTPELRQKWRDYFDEYDRITREYEEECARVDAEWLESPVIFPRVKLPLYPPRIDTPPFPEELRGLT